MSLDGISYGSQGVTGRYGRVDGLAVSTWGKTYEIGLFEIEFVLGLTLEIDSDVVRIFDIDSQTCRDFIIVARDDSGSSFLAKEMTSGVIRNLDLETQVVKSIDILSVTEIIDD